MDQDQRDEQCEEKELQSRSLQYLEFVKQVRQQASLAQSGHLTTSTQMQLAQRLNARRAHGRLRVKAALSHCISQLIGQLHL